METFKIGIDSHPFNSAIKKRFMFSVCPLGFLF